MSFTTEEALQEVLKRSEEIRIRNGQRKTAALAAATMTLLSGLILVIASFAGTATAEITESTYGAFLLSAQYGGYILVAVLAFAAGAALTALIMHRGRDRKENAKKL